MFPRVVVNLHKFGLNVTRVKQRMDKLGINIYGVSKVFCGEPQISAEFTKAGLAGVADSRIENLRKLADQSTTKILLRVPMHSEIEELIEFTDVSLNSEISTLRLISEEAVKQGKIHKVILMVDLGDLREGFFEEEEFYHAVETTMALDGVEMIGIGTNLTCFGAIIPTQEHMKRLVELKDVLKDKYDLNIEVLSGGNSSSYYLAEKGLLPEGINNLRLGEILTCGVETAYGERVQGTFDDVFILEAEIIELKKKPSLPIGEPGMDAFGQKPVYEDKGDMLRAICAIGKQDVDIEGLMPMDNFIEIVGRSSDHMILDVTKSGVVYKVGDIVRFKLKYGGILSAMTSQYVDKKYTY